MGVSDGTGVSDGGMVLVGMVVHVGSGAGTTFGTFSNWPMCIYDEPYRQFAFCNSATLTP